MAINISKLWNNAGFNSLPVNSKLLYLYLISNPSINNIGVVSLIPEIGAVQIGITLSEFKTATQNLIDRNLIYVKKFDGIIYFIIPSHFSTVSKSEAILEKIKSDLKSIPKGLREFLNSIGINTQAKELVVTKPTIEEIESFCISSGYEINAKDFYDFYENISIQKGVSNYWVDSKGKPVRDWKSKLKRVWFKPERKVNIPKDAPKGFEFFSVKINDKNHYPDYWKNGLPHSKDFVINKELKKEYERRTKDSNHLSKIGA